jgi:hypothetical protein
MSYMHLLNLAPSLIYHQEVAPMQINAITIVRKSIRERIIFFAERYRPSTAGMEARIQIGTLPAVG